MNVADAKERMPGWLVRLIIGLALGGIVGLISWSLTSKWDAMADSIASTGAKMAKQGETVTKEIKGLRADVAAMTSTVAVMQRDIAHLSAGQFVSKDMMRRQVEELRKEIAAAFARAPWLLVAPEWTLWRGKYTALVDRLVAESKKDKE